MFPVGTILYIINAGDGALGANKHIGKITNENSTNGLYDFDDGFNVEILRYIYSEIDCWNGSIWRISNNGIYISCPYLNANDDQIQDWLDSIKFMEDCF